MFGRFFLLALIFSLTGCGYSTQMNRVDKQCVDRKLASVEMLNTCYSQLETPIVRKFYPESLDAYNSFDYLRIKEGRSLDAGELAPEDYNAIVMKAKANWQFTLSLIEQRNAAQADAAAQNLASGVLVGISAYAQARADADIERAAAYQQQTSVQQNIVIIQNEKPLCSPWCKSLIASGQVHGSEPCAVQCQ
jgi:hypothetical protein